MSEFEKTPYETNPVESPAEAVKAFVEAYDVLQTILTEFDSEEGELSVFADSLRAAMYRPVSPDGGSRPSISLYEIGVVYFPEGAGRYDISTRKLSTALRQRENDVRALFVQEDGILPNLCEILPAFLEEERDEYVYAAAMRFLNECRRLIAMWE
ncbi:MAG: hypothetical protein FWC89_03400 [Defluviitaleaceae bacterium]|nr:hypothetical protein [Defluviitaleaceae bacterium]